MSDLLSAKDEVTILIIDDDPVDRRAMERALRRHGLATTTLAASDGLEALELLRSGTVPEPRIALLDINMPRLGGIGFLEAIRSDPDLRSLVVFVLTTSDHDRDVMAAYDHNVAGYIVKTDIGEDLMKVVGFLDDFVVTIRLPQHRRGT